jgi:hypothetical protein
MSIKWRIAMFTLASLFLAVTGAQAGDPVCAFKSAGMQLLKSQSGFKFALSTTPAQIKLGKPFDLSLLICSSLGRPYTAGLAVDARMPKHGHGMNYKPAVTKSAPGKYLAKGMLLHMPGKWQFRLHIQDAGKAVVLTMPHKQK